MDDVTADAAADLSLEAVAGRVGVSVRQLTRLFRAETGMTVTCFVEQIRLEAAQGLLESGTDPLDVVARRSGFGCRGDPAPRLPAGTRHHPRHLPGAVQDHLHSQLGHGQEPAGPPRLYCVLIADDRLPRCQLLERGGAALQSRHSIPTPVPAAPPSARCWSP